MRPRLEVVAVDCLMVRLFDEIAEASHALDARRQRAFASGVCRASD